jgi:hypothetical protein
MKRISFSLLAAVALAILTFSISAAMLSSDAYASKMNGKHYGCSYKGCGGINSPKFGKKNGKKTTSSSQMRIGMLSTT